MKLYLSDIPKDHPVQPLRKNQSAKKRCTCETCGLSWDDGVSTGMTPTPSGRCPFEWFHKEEEESKYSLVAVNIKTNAKEMLSSEPLTWTEAKTMRSKFDMVYPGIDIRIEHHKEK